METKTDATDVLSRRRPATVGCQALTELVSRQCSH